MKLQVKICLKYFTHNCCIGFYPTNLQGCTLWDWTMTDGFCPLQAQQHWPVSNRNLLPHRIRTSKELKFFDSNMKPHSNKANNQVFHLQNQARPLHSTAHTFKTTASICIITGSIGQRAILRFFALQQGWASVGKNLFLPDMRFKPV